MANFVNKETMKYVFGKNSKKIIGRFKVEPSAIIFLSETYICYAFLDFIRNYYMTICHIQESRSKCENKVILFKKGCWYCSCQVCNFVIPRSYNLAQLYYQ